jgi:hypothetical protein
VTANELRQKFADENFEALLDLLDAVEKLTVTREDFEPDWAPADDAQLEDWQDHHDNLVEFADAIDDNLCVALADVEAVARQAREVRKNLGL